ncbi:hypothetical protein Lalb_Chr01g0016111 [Lupinus albus]|uniref:Uncharacterized protein n=1 Tax=Lupinus albus TaxID=3870 RepID=A0A6A4R826_LUPAL|nr:hypothetical protein Lalb_Chr01g0016111 [Lupinus albus]
MALILNCVNSCVYCICGHCARCGVNYFVIKTTFLNLMQSDAVALQLDVAILL